jgi:6-phosphogluconolactonase/glucosamine-6-phosphate isomerase/deaminase
MTYYKGNAPDLEGEMRICLTPQCGADDLVLIGFGENGRIAFNDPALADFLDLTVTCSVGHSRHFVGQIDRAKGTRGALVGTAAPAYTMRRPESRSSPGGP